MATHPHLLFLAAWRGRWAVWRGNSLMLFLPLVRFYPGESVGGHRPRDSRAGRQTCHPRGGLAWIFRFWRRIFHQGASRTAPYPQYAWGRDAGGVISEGKPATW